MEGNRNGSRRRLAGMAGAALLGFCLLFLAEGCGNLPETASQKMAQLAEAVSGETALSDVAFVSSEKVPEYEGEPYVTVDGNEPDFSEEELSQTESYETYSTLDALGRCGTAEALVGTDLMPDEERGKIGQVKPSGWHTVKYDEIDGLYLYNRCHLIAYQLTSENANEENLITGTRYMNVQGMLTFEEQVGDYVRETGNHVLYRVTPVFEGENLVASGVEMEAESIEDDGAGIRFHVYVFNIQPGITIDYTDGDSYVTPVTKDAGGGGTGTSCEIRTYLLNTSSRKFHDPSCSGAADISETNREEFTGSREELLERGYEPCGRCNP